MGCFMKIEEDVFKRSHVDYQKLLKYGFHLEKDCYQYEALFFDDQFKAIIRVDMNGVVTSKIIELDTEEEYFNLRTNSTGEFVSNVRSSYEELLYAIKKNCFTTDYFTSMQANRIADYIEKSYQISPLFLWDSTPYAGVFKNPNTNKWFGIVMEVDRSKLKDGSGLVSIMNLKLDPDVILNLLEKNGYYKAYHMNKKSWITVLLDDTLADKEIEELVDQSFQNISASDRWIIPANPKYYDIVHCFDHTDVIEWKQSSDIHVGDILYLYVAAPYSRLFYKCRSIEVNIPYYYEDNHLKIDRIMKIQLLDDISSKNFHFKYLNSLGIYAIRGPRRITKKIASKL